MIYGTPAYHIDDDQTDRIGIRTLVVSLMWQPSRWPMPLPELAAEAPPVPEADGGLWLIGKQTRRAGGGLRTSWTFEGVDGNGKTVTFKERSNSLDYAFKPGFSQKSILVLPNAQQLLDTYGGTVIDGQIHWLPTIDSGTKGAGLSGDGKTAGKHNPMYGQDTYISTEGTYTFRYAAFGLSGLNSGVGFIASALPGHPPPLPPGRSWLKIAPETQRRGPVFEITEGYWMSGIEGWPAPIYKPGGDSAANDLSAPLPSTLVTSAL